MAHQPIKLEDLFKDAAGRTPIIDTNYTECATAQSVFMAALQVQKTISFSFTLLKMSLGLDRAPQRRNKGLEGQTLEEDGGL